MTGYLVDYRLKAKLQAVVTNGNCINWQYGEI